MTVAATAIAASMDALAPLFVILLSLTGLVVATRWPILLFYAYCAAVPLNFALPSGPAGTVGRIGGLIFFVGYLLRRPTSLHPSTVPLVGWVFVGWTLASCLWAIDMPTAFDSWLTLAQLFGITVLVASVVADRAETVEKALWSYTIAATLTAGDVVVSFLQGGAIFERATAFAYQDPALVASVVLPAAVFLMGEIQSHTTSGLVRTLALASLTICAAALALSGTRSAWVGILAAIVAWLVVQREPRQALAIAALACGVTALVAVVPGVGDFLSQRVALGVATGGSGRIDIWTVGLGILASAPLIGVGFANFPLAFTPYAIAQAPAASAAGGALASGLAPHNVLLGASVETGLVGSALLVVFFASALRQ
ncbi:MAG: O-antigen ligase family protein, partial [Candidatus Limnocylindrales bacterium]